MSDTNVEEVYRDIDRAIVDLKKIIDISSNLRLEAAKMEMKIFGCYKPVTLKVIEELRMQKNIDENSRQEIYPNPLMDS